eukprot:3883463-Rhodomonas_salina.2
MQETIFSEYCVQECELLHLISEWRLIPASTAPMPHCESVTMISQSRPALSTTHDLSTTNSTAHDLSTTNSTAHDLSTTH